MEKVVGIGGVFVRAKDRKALAGWYKDHLGLDIDDAWFGAILPGISEGQPDVGGGLWSAFEEETDYFGARENQFMVNFRVANRDAILNQLKNAGCNVDEKIGDNEFGHFCWVTDPEGNRVELWQPPATPARS
ncbi:MAG: VOC family protein [Planctomycetota bacterium]|nr:VOC family protein [Planctomycetota bacterium]